MNRKGFLLLFLGYVAPWSSSDATPWSWGMLQCHLQKHPEAIIWMTVALPTSKFEGSHGII